MTIIPDGGIFLALLIVPFSAGTLCGLTGSGSAIIVQVLFRLFQSLLNLSVASDDAESNRRILAIAAVLSLSQYPVAVFKLWKSKERHIRWDAVAYLFPGLNIVVWLGTFIAMRYPPGILLYILGTTLIAIALWQFLYQSVIGRKVDDEKVKTNARRRLNQKHQLQLTQQSQSTTDLLPNQTTSSDSTTTTTASTTTRRSGDNLTNTNTTTNTTNTTPGTDLSDLETLGDIEPSLPKRLKPPNPSFDLYSYSNRNGLNLSITDNKTPNKLPKLQPNGGFNNNNDDETTISNPNGYISQFDTIDENNTLDENGNDYTVVSIDDTHKLIDERPFYIKMIDDAKNNPMIMIIGICAGLLGGLLGGMMGINGPPIILYLFYLKLNGAQLRDTSIIIFFTNLPCLLLARIIFHVFLLEEWLLYSIAICASTIGLFVGTKFHSYCDTRLIMTFLQIVILLSSITLTKPGMTTITSWVYLIIYLLLALGALAFIFWRIARNNLIKQQVKQQFYTLNNAAAQTTTR